MTQTKPKSSIHVLSGGGCDFPGAPPLFPQALLLVACWLVVSCVVAECAKGQLPADPCGFLCLVWEKATESQWSLIDHFLYCGDIGDMNPQLWHGPLSVRLS